MAYEFVEDTDGVEHVIVRSGTAWEHVPLCDRLDTPLFDGRAPEMCEECQRQLAAIGDRDLLAAAVAGARPRWLAFLPGASPLADDVLTSATADAEAPTVIDAPQVRGCPPDGS